MALLRRGLPRGKRPGVRRMAEGMPWVVGVLGDLDVVEDGEVGEEADVLEGAGDAAGGRWRGA